MPVIIIVSDVEGAWRECREYYCKVFTINTYKKRLLIGRPERDDK